MDSYVYILANKKNGTLYTGVTSDLIKRVYQHKTKIYGGFSAKYNVDRLVYFEIHGDISQVILRETRIKGWKRAWKIELIEKENPDWQDLYNSL
ncbi:MAG: hypothetical protein BGO67_02040 [Alphaproteobacteria bacterium 41-28]|nr:MAG: hypothetical protein BGO67_02040 [Alphaproteobacteria bacterium 41-28]